MHDASGQEPTSAIRVIVFYDGVCPFCHAAVRWLIEHDRARFFCFAALQGATAAALRERWPGMLPADSASVILVDLRSQPPRCTRRSRAVFTILGELGWPWKALCLFEWLPQSLCDRIYEAFAGRRHRLFGRYPECHLPSAEANARLLD